MTKVENRHKLSLRVRADADEARGDERTRVLVTVDEYADRRRRPTSTQHESVLSGRTDADLEREE